MLHIIQGAGWPIWPLIVAAVIALAIVAERAWSLQRARVVPSDLLPRVAQEIEVN
jgi:biopolymer transport protein ExbB